MQKLCPVDDINVISCSDLWIESELRVEDLGLTVAQRASDMTQYLLGRLVHHFWMLMNVDEIQDMLKCFKQFAIEAWDEMKTTDNLPYRDYVLHLHRFEEAYPEFKCGIQFLPEEYEHFNELVMRKEKLHTLENNGKKFAHPKQDKSILNYINAFVDYALEVFSTLALYIECKPIAHKQMRFFVHHLAGAVKLWKDRVISKEDFEFAVRRIFQYSAPLALFVEVDYEFEKYCTIRCRERRIANLKLVCVDSCTDEEV